MILLDKYDISNQDDHDNMGSEGVGESDSYAESFKTPAGTAYVLSRVRWSLQPHGSPTGTLQIKLFNPTGTAGIGAKPTGSALAVSDGVSASFAASGYNFISFDFVASNKYSMSQNTDYEAVISYPYGDINNYFNIAKKSTADTPSIKNKANGNNGTWPATSQHNQCFEVYGEEANSPVITSFVGSPSSINSGSTTSLIWATSNVSTLSINQGIGSVSPTSSGYVVVSPTSSTTYILMALSDVGSTTANATITVTGTSSSLKVQILGEIDFLYSLANQL